MKKLPRKKCLNCDKYCKRATTKFCSRDCMNAYRSKHKLRRGGPVKKLTNRLCKYCNKDYSPYRNSQKFCSKTCSAKYRVHVLKDRKFIDGGIKSAKNMTPERRRKLSLAMIKRNKEQGYTKGIGGVRKDLGHYVRSRWEANICRLLKYLNISYKYESCSFVLKDDKFIVSYIPDMQLSENVFIEVKGWETEKAKRKRILMAQQYPDIHIIYIREKRYKKISLFYKDIIDNWEFDKRHGR